MATRRPTFWPVIGGLSAFIVFGLASVVAILDNDSNAATAVVLIPIFGGLTLLLAHRFARRDRDPRVFGVVLAGFGVKLLGMLTRYWFAFIASGGVADATGYDQSGQQLAPAIRALHFGVDTGRPIPGTGFIRLLTGIVYAVIGSSRLGGFVVFAWLGFLGAILFWRAFRIAVPTGDSVRYALFVFLLPSLVFWPSGIGKEAWMMLALGLCSYGIANVFAGHFVGALTLAPGIVGVGLVRPHIALLVYCGLMFALLVRKNPKRSMVTPAAKLVLLAVLLGAGVVIVSQTKSFLGVETLTQESIQEKLTTTAQQTGQGGSEFSAVTVTNPLDIPLAVVTVLFRPLPTEAGNLQSFIAAIEGTIVLLICIRSWSRLRTVPRRIRREPYVAYALGFVIVFILAFSSFSNFGLLARERTQMLPLLLVLVSVERLPRDSPTPIRARTS